MCVGSLDELSGLTGTDQSGLDPHRPFVDAITFACPTCGKEAHRVPEVIDGWFDSGSMPFAQWGYPHAPGSVEKLQLTYPADFICEAIDQTRGWFYSLMAVGTLVFDRSSYKNVLCLGHILAEDGRKMSKHLGNILLPIPLMDEHGADAVRWFMAAGGSPVGGTPGRAPDDPGDRAQGAADLLEHGRVPGPVRPGQRMDAGRRARPRPAGRHVLDRWLTSSTHDLVVQVTDALENFDTQRAGQLHRRVRRRPVQLVRAPLAAPLLGRRPLGAVHPARDPRHAHPADGPDGAVHHRAGVAGPHRRDRPATHRRPCTWRAGPLPTGGLIDPELEASMALTRRLVELGRSARSEAKVKTRQPLRRALIPTQAFARLSDELLAEIAAELNIGSVESFSDAGDLVDHSAKANFRALGKRFGKQTPVVANAIAGADAAALAASLAASGEAGIEVDGIGTVTVGPDEVIVSERPREGWSLVNEQGETVALDLELTPELVSAGLARDVIRFVQETRKNSGLDVTDRIGLRWTASGEVAGALDTHRGLIAAEVLATVVERVDESGVHEDDDAWVVDEDLGLAIRVSRA